MDFERKIIKWFSIATLPQVMSMFPCYNPTQSLLQRVSENEFKIPAFGFNVEHKIFDVDMFGILHLNSCWIQTSCMSVRLLLHVHWPQCNGLVCDRKGCVQKHYCTLLEAWTHLYFVVGLTQSDTLNQCTQHLIFHKPLYVQKSTSSAAIHQHIMYVGFRHRLHTLQGDPSIDLERMFNNLNISVESQPEINNTMLQCTCVFPKFLTKRGTFTI